MRILFIGDIFGASGRGMLSYALPKLKDRHIDFVIANGENVSGGRGLSKAHYKELIANGVQCITMGNHWRDEREIERYIDAAPKIVRPLNLIGYHRGVGSKVFDVNGVPVRVTNVLGTAFMPEAVTVPFLALNDLLGTAKEAIHIVDYHAESSSEKHLFAYAFDGKVTAVLGTHTHVATADSRILEKGTAYQTDVGMVGLRDGAIGISKETALDRFVYGRDVSLDGDAFGLCQFCATLLDIDEKTGKARSIERIYMEEDVHG